MAKRLAIFKQTFELRRIPRERCKGVHCVDLGESFPTIAIPTSISLQNLASIQPRTSLVKFARSPCTDPLGLPGPLRCHGCEANRHSALQVCTRRSWLHRLIEQTDLRKIINPLVPEDVPNILLRSVPKNVFWIFRNGETPIFMRRKGKNHHT